MNPAEVPTDIAHVHESLQRSEEFNQALLSTVSDLIFELRKDGLILGRGQCQSEPRRDS